MTLKETENALKTVNVFLTEFFKVLEEEHSGRVLAVKMFVMDGLWTLDLPNPVTMAFKMELTHSKFEKTDLDIELNKIEAMLDLLYEGSCEVLGPVLADYSFDDCIKRVLKTPENYHFDIREFL